MRSHILTVFPPNPRPPDFRLRPFVQGRLLDPRPAAEALARPILDSVNIPVRELGSRVAELPPRGHMIQVVGVVDCELAIQSLVSRGRPARRCDEFVFGASNIDALPRLWRPAEWVEQSVAMLRPGRALDIACGGGRDAVHLASLGWEVWANDVLPDAIHRGQALAQRYASAIEPIHWTIGTARELPKCVFAPIGLLICVRFLDRELLSNAHRMMAPGGAALVEAFTAQHRERHGKPAGDTLVVEPDELGHIFADWEIVQLDENWRADGSHTARILARRT